MNCKYILLTIITFLTFSVSIFGQCPAPGPLDIPNPLDDPSCDVTAGDCTSNDLQLIGASLDLDIAGCNSCEPGDMITGTLSLTINNSTGSTRTSFAIFGILQITDPNGVVTNCPISRCNGPLPGNTITTLPYGEITYTCGDQLELTDLIISWTDASPNSNCANHDCKEIAPKCGSLTSIIITPPLTASVTAECVSGSSINVDLTVMGGDPNFTYSWEGPGGSTYTTEDLMGVTPGTYDVTVTDANGCTSSNSITLVNCCTYSPPTCLLSGSTMIEGCDANVTLPDPLVEADVFSGGTFCTSKQFQLVSTTSAGTLCGAPGLTITRTYRIWDDLNTNGSLDTGEPNVTCDEVFLVVDSTPPTWTTNAGDLDATYTCADDEVAPTPPVASDNCTSNTVTVTETSNTVAAGSCPNSYVRTIEWTADDGCGNNSAVFTATITVNDETPPNITLSPTSDLDGTIYGCLIAPPSAPEFSATDNCSTSPVSVSPSTVEPIKNGCEYSQTWTANHFDACGNPAGEVSVTYHWTIQEPIIFDCPGDFTTANCIDESQILSDWNTWLSGFQAASGGCNPITVFNVTPSNGAAYQVSLTGSETLADVVPAPNSCDMSIEIEMVITDDCLDPSESCMATFTIPSGLQGIDMSGDPIVCPGTDGHLFEVTDMAMATIQSPPYTVTWTYSDGVNNVVAPQFQILGGVGTGQIVAGFGADAPEGTLTVEVCGAFGDCLTKDLVITFSDPQVCEVTCKNYIFVTQFMADDPAQSVFRANLIVESDAMIQEPTNPKTEFYGGLYVRLLPGFKVHNGATFLADGGTCDDISFRTPTQHAQFKATLEYLKNHNLLKDGGD